MNSNELLLILSLLFFSILTKFSVLENMQNNRDRKIGDQDFLKFITNLIGPKFRLGMRT